MVRTALAVFAVTVLCPLAAAGTLKVPADQPTIADALAAAVPGDVILVSAGTYAESVAITGKRLLTLQAKGAVVLQGAEPVLQIDDCVGVEVEGFTLALDSGDAPCQVTGSKDCALRQLTIAGEASGVRLQDSSNVVVSDCDFTGLTGVALFATGCARLLVEKCTVDEATIGIQFGDFGEDPVTNSTVSRNTFRDCSVAGFQDTGGSVLLVERNVVEDGAGDGLSLGSISDTELSVVTRNTIRDLEGAGIPIRGGAITVDRNVLTDLGGNGIDVIHGGGSNRILSNKLAGMAGIGISAGDDDVVEANSVKQAAVVGIQANGARMLVRGNQVKDAGDIGLTVNGSEVLVEGNTVSGAAGDAFKVLSSGHTLVDNVSTKAGAVGFHLHASGNTLCSNRSKASGSFGLQDPAGGNTYVDNVFDTEDPANLP